MFLPLCDADDGAGIICARDGNLRQFIALSIVAAHVRGVNYYCRSADLIVAREDFLRGQARPEQIRARLASPRTFSRPQHGDVLRKGILVLSQALM